MAEILKTFSFRRTGSGNGYPWPEWFDGKIRRLIRGKDFHTSIQSLRAIVSLAAARHGVAAHLYKENADTAVLQAEPRNGKRK